MKGLEGLRRCRTRRPSSCFLLPFLGATFMYVSLKLARTSACALLAAINHGPFLRTVMQPYAPNRRERTRSSGVPLEELRSERSSDSLSDSYEAARRGVAERAEGRGHSWTAYSSMASLNHLPNSGSSEYQQFSGSSVGLAGAAALPARPGMMSGDSRSSSYYQWERSANEKDDLGYSTELPYARDDAYVLEKRPQYRRDGNDSDASRRRKRRKVIIIVVAIVGSLIIIGAAVGAAIGVIRSKQHSSQADEGHLTAGLAGTAAAVKPTGSVAPSTATSSAGGAVPTSTDRQLVVFGASWCDNGHSRPSKYQASLKKSPYYGGRSSNGIVWDEYLSQAIGVGGKNATLINYAYAGALVDNTLSSGATVPDTAAQMQSFANDLKSGAVATPVAGSRTLVAVWIGLNSVIAAWQSATSMGQRTLNSGYVQSANANMQKNAASLFAQIEQLEANLTSLSIAHDWLILPLPMTNILPYAVFSSKGKQDYLSLYGQLTTTFNAAVTSSVSSWSHNATSQMVTMDVPGLYTMLMNQPSLVAGASDTTNPCVAGSSTCSNPSSRIWWDSMHMTTNAHKWFASNVQGVVQSLWR